MNDPLTRAARFATVTEAQLIDRARRGDPRAERRLYDAHVDRVWRLAYRMTGDRALAEDLTQETFLRVFDGLAGFRGDAALSTWLHAIAMRTVIGGLRKIRRLRDHESDLDDPPDPPAPRRPDAELRLLLDEAIAALPDPLRVVFLLHDVEGFKHREIADGLDIPAGTSKARLHRARAWLRDYLARTGFDLEENVS
jgi:RNA polymerase sigma-70 factor (ECF subfamily)